MCPVILMPSWQENKGLSQPLLSVGLPEYTRRVLVNDVVVWLLSLLPICTRIF